MIFRGKYAFLSNFSKSTVMRNGFAYATVEHAYQSAKAARKEDMLYIRAAPTPAEAKRRGRLVLIVDGWDRMKIPVMWECICSKFEDANLRKQLLATGTEVLTHDNNHGDTFWGCVNGVGENQLGMLLMRLREALR